MTATARRVYTDWYERAMDGELGHDAFERAWHIGPHYELAHKLHMLIAPHLPCRRECNPPKPPSYGPAPSNNYGNGQRSKYEEIKDRYRVEDLVSQWTDLWGHGPKYTAKCPFHGERNGRALSVDADKQLWKCFGKCGRGGDVIDLIKFASEKGLRGCPTI